ncbi:MAG: glucan biosynthesis protein G [Pseudomonadota bacterium]|nr:glucan biosynthesis protein G [Pseudomonadota bacterium]
MSFVCGPALAARQFGLDDVAGIARGIAAKPYKAPLDRLPQELRDLDYDALRDIRFKPDHALWRAEKLPFELMFLHLGRGVREPVAINTIEPAGVRRIPFNSELFDYGRNRLDVQKLRDIGFAGFRVHYSINTPNYKDEVMVFLGASYFRALGKGQHYGLSARGLAVDTAQSSGEEFPRFSEFWIERPKRNATTLTVYALLESRRLAGAYRFVLTPGADTVVQIAARLYLRDPIGKIGIAPLTSMYAFGENQPGRDDYRPEVHDSDGLSVETADGEWIWRPLVNPRRLLVTSFALTSPKGFGLMQRDRASTSYEDPEAFYERRPSTWVEPIGAWGAGRVELVQIPSPDETNDNIVAYWVPNQAPAPGKPAEFAYRLHWLMQGAMPQGRAWVTQTRRGRGYVKQPDGDLNFIVDFDGPSLRALGLEPKLEPNVSVDSNAELRELNLFRNRASGAWRMTVRVKRTDASKPVELRAFIAQQGNPISETWAYIVPAEAEKP